MLAHQKIAKTNCDTVIPIDLEQVISVNVTHLYQWLRRTSTWRAGGSKPIA